MRKTQESIRVLKYPLFDVQGSAAINDHVSLDMPLCTHGQFVGLQNGVITLWLIARDHEPKVKRHFFFAGTGQPVEPGFYLGSVFDRSFVWHVFEYFPEADHG